MTDLQTKIYRYFIALNLNVSHEEITLDFTDIIHFITKVLYEFGGPFERKSHYIQISTGIEM